MQEVIIFVCCIITDNILYARSLAVVMASPYFVETVMVDGNIAPKFRSFIQAENLPDWTIATVTGLRKPKKREFVSCMDSLTRRISLEIFRRWYFTTAWINLTDNVLCLIETHGHYNHGGNDSDIVGLDFQFKFCRSGPRSVVAGIKLTSEGL